MVGQTPQPPKVVARKMPKDELLLSRQRFLVVVEIVLGFSLVFVFGGALAFGISELGAATACGLLLRTALLAGGLAAGGVTLFLRVSTRWWHSSHSGSSG